MNFGQNLKNLRKSKNISQEKLAERVMVSRQSVSKWETGEAYPEMNNILELCKIFHCSINDLVNNNILDIDSLDEDIKMNAVKFKKEKQKQMKGISNILSLLGKIGAIVARVGLVFVIIIMIAIPILFTNVDIEDNKIVSNNNTFKVLEVDNSYNVKIGNTTIMDDIRIKDVEKLSSGIEKYSKTGFVLLLELGLGLLVGFIIVLIKALKCIELLFANIHNGDTPFTLDNTKYIKKMSYYMIACIVISNIAGIILGIVFNNDVDLNIFSIFEILFVYSMSLIFEYGYEIQLDSKGKIYDDEK